MQTVRADRLFRLAPATIINKQCCTCVSLFAAPAIHDIGSSSFKAKSDAASTMGKQETRVFPELCFTVAFRISLRPTVDATQLVMTMKPNLASQTDSSSDGGGGGTIKTAVCLPDCSICHSFGAQQSIMLGSAETNTNDDDDMICLSIRQWSRFSYNL